MSVPISVEDDDPPYMSKEAWTSALGFLKEYDYFSSMENTYVSSDSYTSYLEEDPVLEQRTGAQTVGCASPIALVTKVILMENYQFVLHMSDNSIAKLPIGRLPVLQSSVCPRSQLTIAVQTEDLSIFLDSTIWESFLEPVNDLTILGSMNVETLTHFLTHAGGRHGLKRLNILPTVQLALDFSIIYNLLPKEMDHLYIDKNFVSEEGRSRILKCPGPKCRLVSKLIFHEDKITVVYDTQETNDTDPTAGAFGKSHINLEIDAQSTQTVATAYANMNWHTFLLKLNSITMPESLSIFALERILCDGQAVSLNCPVNNSLSHQSFLHIKPSVTLINITHVYFDARGTSYPGMVDNITALCFIFARSPGVTINRDDFQQITLIVNDFCIGGALDRQISRLNRLLASTPGKLATATIVSMVPGDDRILRNIKSLGFVFTHRGFVKNLTGKYNLFDFWTRKADSQLLERQNKSIILGLRTRTAQPIDESELPCNPFASD